MPWPKGKSRKASDIARKASRARWDKKAKKTAKNKFEKWNKAAAEKVAKKAEFRLHDLNEQQHKDVEDAKDVKRRVMKENRLRACKFDPKKAPPPIQFVPNNETPPPADPTDEIIAELKRLGCPMANKQPEDEIEAACEESASETLAAMKSTEPTPQFAALSSKFIAELAFHMANLMKGK